MLTVKLQRRLIILTQFILLGILVSGCTKRHDSAYKAACHGDPLTTATRTQAIENGWQVNELYDCVDKASYDKWAAAVSPEELAAVTSPSSAKQKKVKVNPVHERADREQYIAEALANMNTRPVEANTAYYFELGNIVGALSVP